MHSPIWSYDRTTRHVCSVDRRLGLLTSFDEFQVQAPRLLTVRGKRGDE